MILTDTLIYFIAKLQITDRVDGNQHRCIWYEMYAKYVYPDNKIYRQMIIQDPLNRCGSVTLQSLLTDCSKEQRCSRCFTKGPEYDSDSQTDICFQLG